VRQFSILNLLVVVSASSAYSQPPEPRIAFEVASIKTREPGKLVSMSGCLGGPGSDEPTRITCEYVSIQLLIMRAYGVKPYQIVGPSWLDSEHFDIQAKTPSGATRSQVEQMFQNLLAERFGLALHRATKDLTVYSLVAAKDGGSKLKPASTGTVDRDDGSTAGKPAKGPDGFPVLLPAVLAHGPITLYRNGRARMQAGNVSVADIAMALTNQLDQLVVDQTGLQGRYELTLYWTPEDRRRLNGAPREADNLPASADADLFVAVQQQLGLRLTPKKQPMEVLVIDHVERTPTPN
jgi:uncharacterized protein (TIGR03435 family)